MKSKIRVAIILVLLGALSSALAFFTSPDADAISDEATTTTAVATSTEAVAPVPVPAPVPATTTAPTTTTAIAPRRLNIAIVPGHDDASWGADFRGIKEADLTVALGDALAKFLRTDPNIKVTLIRTPYGYDQGFESYYESNFQDILSWIKERATWKRSAIKSGSLVPVTGIIHNNAKASVVDRLYAINRWANDSGVDLVLHIHFNDYPGRSSFAQGKYQGFAIYVPEKQFSNATTSMDIASYLLQSLSRFYVHSNMPKEDTGIVQDQNLIAIGANNSLKAAGVLIEYAYIYESSLLDKIVRDQVIQDLAYQTFLGIESYSGHNLALKPYPTTILPYIFERPMSSFIYSKDDALALQRALAISGFYPPEGFSKYDCPSSGFMRACTTAALAAFQKANNITPADGKAGVDTLKLLNSLFAPKASPILAE